MAGMGWVCSRVGALLYALENINYSHDSTSCTDILYLWNVPSTSGVVPQPLKGMEFGRVVSSSQISDVPPFSTEIMIDVLGLI